MPVARPPRCIVLLLYITRSIAASYLIVESEIRRRSNTREASPTRVEGRGIWASYTLGRDLTRVVLAHRAGAFLVFWPVASDTPNPFLLATPSRRPQDERSERQHRNQKSYYCVDRVVVARFASRRIACSRILNSILNRVVVHTFPGV